VSPDPAAAFVLRLGQALHASGYAADRVEQLMASAAVRLGAPGQFFSLPTMLMAAFGPLDQQRTHLIRVEPGAVNLARMAALEAVARDVEAARLTPVEGLARVDRLMAMPRPWPGPVVVLAYGAASATGCRFLNGGAAEVGLAALVGLLLGALSVTVAHAGRRIEFFEFVGGLLGAALVTAIGAWGFRTALSTTVLGGILTLLPGLTLTVAMTELASRHLSSGTARLMGAVVGLTALAIGAAVGTALVTAIAGPVRPARIVALAAWTRYVALAVAPFAFGVLLGARPRDLPWILVAVVIGFGGLQVGQRTLGAEVGAAIGALAVGLAANLFERCRLGPAAVVQVPGILVLVPGSIGFRGITALIDEHLETGFAAWSGMLLTAVALAAGLLLSNVVLPPRARAR
jgi:uncharacterized membrane protein YjjP (DUF1212 family)